jgi:hypothetical protein
MEQFLSLPRLSDHSDHGPKTQKYAFVFALNQYPIRLKKYVNQPIFYEAFAASSLKIAQFQSLNNLYSKTQKTPFKHQ